MTNLHRAAFSLVVLCCLAGAAHNSSPAAVALAWTMRSGHVIAIPESGSAEHVKENAVALSLTLTASDIAALDAAFTPGR